MIIFGTPSLRYNLQDYLVEFDTSECDCCRTLSRISIGGRALDRVAIDGKVFYPSTVVFAIKDAIQKEKIKINEWQLVPYANREFIFKAMGTEDVPSILENPITRDNFLGCPTITPTIWKGHVF